MFDAHIFGKIFDTLVLDDLEPELPDVPDLPDEMHPSVPAPPRVNQNLLEIKIVNDKRTVHITSAAAGLNVLFDHDGLTSAYSELAHFDNAILDGGAISGSRTQSRRVTLDFVAKGLTHQGVSALFPQGKKETIYVTRAGTTRIIEGYRDGRIELLTSSALATPKVSVSFLCSQPFFRGERDIEVSLDSVSGGLEYPIEPYGYPVHYGTFSGDGVASILNRGDYPAPFVLTMSATTAGTLGLEIDGEEYARIQDVSSGEHIVFDTGVKMLTIDGQRRLRALDGTFPTLPVGASEIRLTGVSGNPRITFTELFEGV